MTITPNTLIFESMIISILLIIVFKKLGFSIQFINSMSGITIIFCITIVIVTLINVYSIQESIVERSLYLEQEENIPLRKYSLKNK